MKYTGRAYGKDAELAIEKEGLRIGSRFLDYADVKSLRPLNHRVVIETFTGEPVEISMLGFSYDGFWEDLSGAFSDRNLAALFAEDQPVMFCEGEYETAQERGRGQIALMPDAVCILPQTYRAVRIPLCFASNLQADGYLLHITLQSGENYTVGRMGYDTAPFFERARQCADRVKKERAAAIKAVSLTDPFTHKGLFRTTQPDKYWQAAFGSGVCAVELFTGDDAATYLYRFSEQQEVFLARLEQSMEAMGPYREIIYWSNEQLAEKPLYRMAVLRSNSVSFLRERSAGRLIHSAGHLQRLREFLGKKQ